MVVATCKQSVATAAAVTEGVVNLVTSVWLAQHMGALGVALGTLLGAVAGVAMHFGVSMRYTQTAFAISRIELFANGMLRPAAIAIPSSCSGGILTDRLASFSLPIGFGWVTATLLLAWMVSMSRADRDLVLRVVRGKLSML